MLPLFHADDANMQQLQRAVLNLEPKEPQTMNYATPRQMDRLWQMMLDLLGAAELNRGWQYMGPAYGSGHCFRKRAGMPTANGGTESANVWHTLHI